MAAPAWMAASVFATPRPQVSCPWYTIRRAGGDSSRTREMSRATCAGTACPRVSQMTMSVVPSARGGSLAMESMRSSGT